jgi:hypothetical protein
MLICNFQTFIHLDHELKMATGTRNLMGKIPIRSWVWVTFCTHRYIHGKIVPIGYNRFGYRNYELIPVYPQTHLA